MKRLDGEQFEEFKGGLATFGGANEEVKIAEAVPDPVVKSAPGPALELSTEQSAVLDKLAMWVG